MPSDAEDQPQAYDTKGLAPARKRRLSASESSRPAKKPLLDDTPDDLPQPYNAKDLAPARKRAISPSEPPRKLKRPSRLALITPEKREALRARQLQREREREREAEERERQAEKERSGINEVVRAHYNAVPERGRDWRRTDSNIKGLRAFNNWVKSCIIQKYSPSEDYTPGARAGGYMSDEELLVLDIGCGKGGDLQKWANAPQPVALYVGLDSAEVSIDQARDRYRSMGSRGGRGGRYGGGRPPRMDARFIVKDCFVSSLKDVEIVRQVGFDPTGHALGPKRGFDVVSMMFCLHYAFETEDKARTMLRNVAGALKKGGRFIGTIPNSDIISERVREFNAKEKAKKEKKAAKEAAAEQGKQGEEDEKREKEDEEKEEGEADEDEEEGEAEQTAEWGNKIYRVRFPGETPEDGTFRPPFGWKYNFFLDEAVEEVPEYVVPWGVFRALAEDFNLEMRYCEPFCDVWKNMKDDRELGILSERMGVRERGGGELLVTSEEMEAAGFYLAFCFDKV